MKKTIVGFLAVALFAPFAVFAFIDCTETINGCATNESKIAALQAQVLQLTQLLTQLLAQKNPAAHHEVSWGGVTMDFPNDWKLVTTSPETESQYSAVLQNASGATIATLSKFYAGGDSPFKAVSSEALTTQGGVTVQKVVHQCEGPSCQYGLGDVTYQLEGVGGSSLRITMPLEATVYFKNLEIPKNALDEWVKTIRSLQSGATCFVPQNDLYLGRTDAQTNGEVKKLQLWLKAEGYFPDAQGTGYYGEKTAAAVVKWQKAHGMDFVTTKSGVGKMTRAKMQEACTTPSSVKKINWIIEKANPSITDDNDYRKYEQVISVDVTSLDNSTKRYSVGKALGCADKKITKLWDDTSVLGQVSCYYALTGTAFTAYDRNGKIVIEQFSDDASGITSGKTTVVLEL